MSSVQNIMVIQRFVAVWRVGDVLLLDYHGYLILGASQRLSLTMLDGNECKQQGYMLSPLSEPHLHQILIPLEIQPKNNAADHSFKDPVPTFGYYKETFLSASSRVKLDID